MLPDWRLLASCLLPFSLPGERYLGSGKDSHPPDAKLGHPELHHPCSPARGNGRSLAPLQKAPDSARVFGRA